MGYKIIYGHGIATKRRKLSGSWMLGLLFMALATFARFYWEEGAARLSEFLLTDPLRNDAMTVAFLAEQIATGELLGDVVGVFCQEIIGGSA